MPPPQAAVAQAQWKLDQKRVSAPAEGLVYDTLYRQGEWVPAGSPVVQMLPPQNVKVRFFVPETIVGQLALGRARDAPLRRLRGRRAGEDHLRLESGRIHAARDL